MIIRRFMITIKSERLRWFRTHRGFLAGCALVLAVLLKGGMFWEFVVSLYLNKARGATILHAHFWGRINRNKGSWETSDKMGCAVF